MRIKNPKQPKEFKKTEPEGEDAFDAVQEVSGQFDSVPDALLLRGKAMKSPDFVSGKRGWQITPEGEVEFQSATIRGNLTILNTSEVQTDLNIEDGATKGADWNTSLSSIPARHTDTATPGLNLTSEYLGFNSDGTLSGWGVYIKSNGDFYFGGDTNNYIDWNLESPGVLTIKGSINMVGGSISWDDISVSGTTSPEDGATQGATWDSDITNQPTDTEIMNEKIANGNYSGGTFISSQNIYSPSISSGTITGATIQTSSGTGKRIEMSSDQIRIYDSFNNNVGIIEGAGQSGVFDLIGMSYVTAGDFTAIGSSLDSLIGIDTSLDLNLSTRKSDGTGGSVKILAESGEDIIFYNDIRPNADAGSYLGTSSHGWGRVYLGSSSRYLEDNAGELYFNNSPVGSGESNTASNLGGTYGWYSSKSGSDLEFKGLSVSSRLNVTNYSNYLYLDHATGSGYNHVPSGGASYQMLRYSSSGVAQWSTDVYGAYFRDNSSTGKYMHYSGSSWDFNDDVYSSGTITAGSWLYGTALELSAGIGKAYCGGVILNPGTSNPSSFGEIINYASGGIDQFRGKPGDGSFVGSFDLTAI